jgi:hypothetical protein
VTGEWIKLLNEELHNLNYSPSMNKMVKSRTMRWAKFVARMGENRNTCRILVGTPEWKSPLERPKHRRADNKVRLVETGWDEVDWIGLTAMESSCECGKEPSGFHRMPGNYGVATQLMASRVVLSSIRSEWDTRFSHPVDTMLRQCKLKSVLNRAKDLSPPTFCECSLLPASQRFRLHILVV